MKTIVVFDKYTKEVLACIPEQGTAICHENVDFAIYNETEPIFTEANGKVLLNENTFMINV